MVLNRKLSLLQILKIPLMIVLLMAQIYTTLDIVAVRWEIDGPKKSKQDITKIEKQSLKGSEFGLLMSVVALNACRNYPGQYTNSHNLPTQPQTH